MTETLMTEAAAPNTEGQASSAPEGNTSGTSTTEAGAPANNVETQQAGEGTADPKNDAKQDGSSQGDGENGEKADSSDSEGSPAEYADFALPEGVQLPADMTDEIKSVAKELNLSQEQAQKLADLAANRVTLANSSQLEALAQAQAKWTEDTKADKEFGGQALTENLAVAKKALDQFGTPELRTLLNESGLGNHPEIIRAFYRAGKAISEDRHVQSGHVPAKPAGRDHATGLYPNQ